MTRQPVAPGNLAAAAVAFQGSMPLENISSSHSSFRRDLDYSLRHPSPLRTSGRPNTTDSMRVPPRRGCRRPSPLNDDAEHCHTPAVSVPPTPSPNASSASAWRSSLAAQCLATQPPVTRPVAELSEEELRQTMLFGREEAPFQMASVGRTASEFLEQSSAILPPPPVLPPQLVAGVCEHTLPPPPAHNAFSSTECSGIDTNKVAMLLSAYKAAVPLESSCTMSPPPSANRRSCCSALEAVQGQQDSIVVKNTFLDVPRSPSLERICKERQVHSCPGSRLASPRGRWHVVSPGSRDQELPSSQASTADTMEPVSSLEDMEHRFPNGACSGNFRGMLLDPMPFPQVEPIVEHGGSSQSSEYDGFEAASGRQVLDLGTLVPPECHPVPQKPQKTVLQLEAILPLAPEKLSARGPPAAPLQTRQGVLPPQLGSAELPSIGSLGHHLRRCKPCAFANRAGCTNGAQCNFCHLCRTGEKKRRRKEKRALIGAMKSLSLATKAEVACADDLESDD